MSAVRVFTVQSELRRQEAKEQVRAARKAWQSERDAERKRLKASGLSREAIRTRMRQQLPLPRSKRQHPPISQYQAYLQSGRWKAFKLSVIAKRGPYCERCKSSHQVQVHHKTYEHIYRERPEDVEILCHSCHESEHGIYPVKRLSPQGVAPPNGGSRRNKGVAG
jgi:hypothetical protein